MEFEQSFPQISCICITDNRIDMLLKSIISFEQQDYPNKQLLISYPDTDHLTSQLIQYLLENTLVPLMYVERPKSESIGQARNHAIARATGDYICMWDDDDLYSTTRLSIQYYALHAGKFNAQASVMSHVLFYHPFNQSAYLSFPSYWACSLLCKKDVFTGHKCIDTDQFEYKSILNFLLSEQLLCIIDDPSIYVFVFHGKNLIRYSTFLYLLNQSETVPKEISENIKIHLDMKIELPF